MKTLATLSLALAFFVACKGDDDPIPDVPDASRADAAIDASPACFDPAGTPANCYLQDVCEPSEDTHFLNGCTDGQCLPFDNSRLARLVNGTLPPLP